MSKLRKMTWVLIAWSALCLVWIIAGVNGADCGAEEYRSACEAGAGIGAALIVGLWFMGFVVLSLIWFMTRPKETR